MARLLYLLAHSTDDPDRAATALDAAAEAAGAGHDVALWLSGEGVRLGIAGVADAIRGSDGRPASESLEALAEKGVVFHVSTPCFRTRKFEEDALHAQSRLAEFQGLARLVADDWTPMTV